MNDKFTNNAHDENENIAKSLRDAAEQIKPTPYFATELEKKLRVTYKPKTGWSFAAFKQIAPAIGWVALVIAFGFLFNWSIRNLIPDVQPGANNTPTGFVCPVTEPNGLTPPGENPSDEYLSNGELWTVLWPNGKVYMLPTDKMSDGSFSMKWGWWRGVTGALTIEGHRLDAEAEPLRADIPEGYGDSGFQVSALIFPTTGCWEVTGRVGDASLTFVTEILFGVATPTPDVDTVIENNATPDPDRPGYDFRGAKLTVDTTMPDSPAQANLYFLPASQPASADSAQALASQFGIQSELYTAERQYPSQPGFMVTDGKQQLVVYGLNDYAYTADIVQSSRNYNGFPNENAESIIREYLSSHGLDFSYRLEHSDLFGGYVLQQISPDGMPMQFESLSQPAMRVTLDENGNILTVTAMMLNYDPAPVGSYGIISADEALQMLLDDSLPAGKIETSAGGPNEKYIPPQSWYREYPNNQTVTMYGNVSSSQPVDPAKPAIVFLDNISATGNTGGMENLERYTFVKATGQFVMDGSVRKFNIESWDANALGAVLTGTLHRDGDQTFLVSADGTLRQYPLVDAPADVPLDTKVPDSYLSVDGVILDGKVYWRSITYYPDASQMGGGGGGGGIVFYPLNLSGTPVPFPTATPMGQSYTPAEIASFKRYTVQNGDTLSQIAATYNISVDDLMQVNYMTDTNIFVGQQLMLPGIPGPTRLDGEHGTVMVNVYAKPDGRQRVAYSFLSQKDQSYYELKGDTLEPLKQLDYRPVAIWGSISFDQYGMPSLTVEKFEALYPDLQLQVLSGTQESKGVSGESLVLFTSGGRTYVQMANTGIYPDGNYLPESDEIRIEGLIVPDETYQGYPVLRVFNIGPATNPATGEKVEFPPNSDTIDVLPDPYGNADQYVQPDAIIEKVELVYFASNPVNQYPTSENSQTDSYIQPAWHFQGRFANGNILDILVQALRQEYLSPDINQNIPPG